MSIREKHTDKMEEILEKEMYADEGFSEIDEEDQRPETQKVMKQERRQQRKNRRKNRIKNRRGGRTHRKNGALPLFLLRKRILQIAEMIFRIRSGVEM